LARGAKDNTKGMGGGGFKKDQSGKKRLIRGKKEEIHPDTLYRVKHSEGHPVKRKRGKSRQEGKSPKAAISEKTKKRDKKSMW